MILSTRRHHPLLSQIGRLAGATALAQGLSIAALPILTRVFRPEDFALLAVFTALLGLISVVAGLRLNLAIPLPQDDGEAAALLSLSLLATTAVSVCVAVLCLGWSAPISVALGAPEIAPFLWLLPPAVWLAATYAALQYWSSRARRYREIARTRLSRSAGGTCTQLLFAALYPSTIGLVAGQIVTSGAGVLSLARSLWRHDRRAFSALTIQQLTKTWRQWWRFPALSVPEALTNAAGLQVPVLLIAAWSAGPEAGFLMLCMRLLGAPMVLLGTSVGQVFLTEAPGHARTASLGQFTKRTITNLAATGVPLIAAAGLLGPLVFPAIFGDSWRAAGDLLFVMTPWFALQFITTPVSAVLQIRGRLGLAIGLQLAGLAMRVGAILLATKIAPHALPEAFSIASAAFYALYLLVILRCAEDRS